MQNNTLPPGAKKVSLSGRNGSGLFVLVSDIDYDKVSHDRWFLNGGYAVKVVHTKKLNGEKTTKTIYMHRVIMDAPDDLVVDHKNHNRLDNRRENLRICTPSENQLNNKAKGYCWDNTSRRWRVTVKEDGKYRYRSYETEEEAKKAVKMIRSGNIPPKKQSYRSKYLPKYISRNTPSGFYFRCVIDGVKYTKYGFQNVVEAVVYRDIFFNNRNINFSRKENK